MRRSSCPLILALLAAWVFPGAVRAQSAPAGTFELATVAGSSEAVNFLIKLESKDGKVVGELVAVKPGFKGLSFHSVTLDGSRLRFSIQGPVEQTFEGQVDANNNKIIVGSFGTETAASPAYLRLTDLTELEAKDTIRPLPVPPMKEALTLIGRVNSLRAKALQSKDTDKRADLLKEAAAADAKAKQELPNLYQEVIAKHADSPLVHTAAMGLFRGAIATKADAEEIRKWATVAGKAAAKFGPRMERDTARQIAAATVNVAGMHPIALDFARQADKLIDSGSSASEQVTILNILANALKKADKMGDVEVVLKRIAALDLILDREYLAKVPSFKGTVFAGRSSKSDRAVVMELFTGATCPPCVAADVAFDVLQRTHKTSELILIQYHMHIPGPDPMTNPDTEARWKHYQNAYPKKVGGVPTAFFNGGAPVVGGGPMPVAEKRYEFYRDLIHPLLENPAGATVSAKATRSGDKIAISAEVGGIAAPSSDMKLRLVLVEETVRFAGSNKIRFHHQVVRAMPGGVDGFALKEKSSKHTANVDLQEVRKHLNAYLDDYAANKRPFPSSDRPFDFGHLRLIALVQDDSTHEILQATQVDVVNGKNER